MLILFTLGVVVVVGVVAGLALGTWWVLVVALLVHATVTLALMRAIFKRTEETGKPDPLDEARQDERAHKPAPRATPDRRPDRDLVI